MLEQVLLEMQQQLAEAKKAVAMAIADEKKLQKQLSVESDKAKEWERKAMIAVRGGDDGLARQALARKQEHENISGQFQTQWAQQKAAVDKLKDALRLLSNKIEEAKRKKNLLVARKKRAEAQAQIANTMQGLGDTSAFDTFDRMSERIQLMEAEAEAGAELAGELSGGDLESKFAALEAGGVGAEEDALAELKAKMGLSLGAAKEAKQLNAGEVVAKADAGNSGGSAASGATQKPATESPIVTPGGLTAEDLKELEDLDLADLDIKK